jgi:hypothetical protein
MNDKASGMVSGLSMALFIAETNRKHPKQIEARLVEALRDLATRTGHDEIDINDIEARSERKRHS